MVNTVSLPEQLPRLPDAYANRSTPELNSGILVVLRQVAPDMGILPTALTHLARMCNRLAHALLLSIDLNAGSTTFAVPLSVELGELLVHGTKEQDKARDQILDGNATGGLVLPIMEPTRWFSEYHEIHLESKLRRLDATTTIQLLAFVEYMVAEWIELGKHYCCQDCDCTAISVQDITTAINNDTELVKLSKYLGTSMSYMQAIAAHFEPNRDAWKKLDAHSWYHKPTEVALLAQKYAYGELLPGDDHFYRKHGIRPLQFFGNHRSLDPKLRTKPPRTTTEDSGGGGGDDEENEGEKGSVVFSFELRDTAGVLVPLVCELRRSRSRARFRLADSGENIADIFPHNNKKLQCVVKWTRDQVARFDVDKQQDEKDVQTSGSNKRLKLTDALAERIVIAPKSKPMSRVSLFHGRPISAASELLVRKRKKYENAVYQLERLETEMLHARPIALLEDKLIIASQLACLGSRLSTSLFTANHPLAVRSHFTATLVDVVSSQVGLPTLPTVLLQLIGEYEPANLPYIKHEGEPLFPENHCCAYTRLLALQPSFDRRAAVNRFTSTLLEVGPVLHTADSGYLQPSDSDITEEEEEEEEEGSNDDDI